MRRYFSPPLVPHPLTRTVSHSNNPTNSRHLSHSPSPSLSVKHFIFYHPAASPLCAKRNVNLVQTYAVYPSCYRQGARGAYFNVLLPLIFFFSIFARFNSSLSDPYPAHTPAAPSPPLFRLYTVSTRFVLAFYEYRFCVTGALVHREVRTYYPHHRIIGGPARGAGGRVRVSARVTEPEVTMRKISVPIGNYIFSTRVRQRGKIKKGNCK